MASEYKTTVTPEAEREIDKLPDAARKDAIERIAELRDIPIPEDALLLDFHDQIYRIYVYKSRYRLIYRVAGKKQRVVVLRVRPRKTAYKGMRGPEG